MPTVISNVVRRLALRGAPTVLVLAPGDDDAGSEGPATIELLVPPSRFDQAMRTLSAMGFDAVDRQPRSYFLRSCWEGVTLVRDGEVSIFLEHHVRPWVWGARLPFDRIERRSRAWVIPSVKAVDPIDGVVIAALRLIHEGADAADWRALVESCRSYDPGTVASVAREAGLDRLIAASFRGSPQEDRPYPLLHELGDRSPSWADRIRLGLLLRSNLRERGDLSRAACLPIRQASAFLAGYVAPSSSFIEHRFGSPFAYGTWWSEAFSRVRGSSVVADPPVPRRSRASREGSQAMRGRSAPMLERARGRRTPDDEAGFAYAGSFFPPMGPVTAAALFGELDGSPPPPKDPAEWSRELPALLQHRLAGLALATAVRDGIDLSEETRSRLAASQLHATAHAIAVEATALEAIGALEERGIPVVVTKGPGIADAYPQRSLRPYGDLDTLVHPEWFEIAKRVLYTLGYEDYFDGGEPRSYFDRHCREGVNLVHEGGGSIDLHHHIPPWVFGERLRFDDLHAASSQTEIAGGWVRIVDPAHNLLIAALHVISDRRVYPGHKLLTWRDVVTLADACDPEVAADEARRMGLDWYLAFILGQLPDPVRPSALAQHLGTPRPGRADAFRLRRLIPPGIGSRHQIAQAFRLPMPNAGLFLFGYAVPSRAFLQRRFGSRRAYLSWWQDATLRLRAAGGAGSGDHPGMAEPDLEALP